MKLFQIYKSKKYLLRMLLSITVLTVIFLISSSVSLYYLSTNSVIKMQKEYNTATLAQINYNITYMDEIAKNMITFLFWDAELTPLMTNEDILILDLVKKLNKLDTIVRSSSFLDSIIVYNGKSNQLFSGGNSKFRSQESEESQHIVNFMKKNDHIQKMKLIPMKLNESSNKIDVFSYIMYANLGSYSSEESALIINIKPKWLFDNVKLINDLAIRQESSIFLMSKEGNMLSSNVKSSNDSEQLRGVISEHVKKGGSSGYFIHNIGSQKQIVAYSRTVIPNWYAVSLQPYTSVIHNIKQIRESSIGLTLIFLLLSTIASFVVSRRLYMPVDRLFSQIKKGLFNDDESTGKDELSYLSDTYTKVVENLHEVKRYERDHRDIVQLYYFRKLLTDRMEYSPEQFIGIVRTNGLNIRESGSYLVLVVTLDSIRKMSQLLEANNIKLFHFAILNIAEEIFNKDYRCMGAEMKTDHMAFLVSSDQELGESKDQLMDLLKQIQDTVFRYYKITISIAMSKSFSRYSEISEQYHRIQQYMMYKLLFGRQSLITPDMVDANMQNPDVQLPPDLERKIVEGIKSGDMEQLEIMFDKLMKHLTRCNYDQIITEITQITLLIRQTLKEMNHNRVQPIDIDMNTLSLKILEMDSLNDIHHLIMQIVYDISQQKKNFLGDRNDILIETIKEIVRQNHADLNLSLQSIAGMMKLSTDYMGRMFKKSEMISVADYINEVRLSSAQEMLETKHYTITEIMEKVGFANQSYFFKLFKKKLGSTPGDYRLKKSLHKNAE
jgi:YesN/AraC family two-component response regulator